MLLLSYANNNDGIGNFLTGATRFLQGKQYDFQAQYTLDGLLPEKWEVLMGGDARQLSLNSKGQEYGTFEGNTPAGTIGAYAQVKYKFSPQLYFQGTARYDYLQASFRGYAAPRLALVYQPISDQVFRVSYNKAVGGSEGGQTYLQAIIGGPADYSVRLWGVSNPLDWNTNNVRMFGRLGGGRTTNTTNLGFNEAITAGATGSKLSADVITYLNSLGLTGGSNIVLKVNNLGTPIKIDQIYKKPIFDNDPKVIGASTSTMYELGYNGTFHKKLNVTVDVWHMSRSNFYSNPQIVTPIASAPTMVADLKAAIAAKADPARLAQLGVTADQIATAIGSQYATRFGLIDIGTLGSETKPSAFNTFVQGADLKYWGVDISAKYDVNSAIAIFANFAYLNQNEFQSALTGNENSGIAYYMMQPKQRFRLGANYNAGKGWNGNVGYSYQSGFDSFQGNATIQKVIKPYSIIDAGAGYNFGNGLTLNLSVTNLLNQYYRSLPQFPQIGRLALLKATYEFGGKKE